MQEYPDFNDTGRNGTSITPFVLGAVLGAGIALLLAPAQGRDTRKRVGSTMKRWGDGAREAMKRTGENLNQVTHDAKAAIEKGRQEYLRSRGPEVGSGSRTPTV